MKKKQPSPMSHFTDMTIDRAIYATGWDGNIVVAAKSSGMFEVITGVTP